MKNLIKSFFEIPQTQRNGFFILMIILLIIAVAPSIYKNFIHNESKNDFSKFVKEIESFQQSLEPVKTSEVSFSLHNSEISASKLTLRPFPFNPNNLPAEEWMRMGFTEKQVKTIKNYELKGGKFRVKSDLKKLYVITDEMYSILEPYILLPENLDRGDYSSKNVKLSEPVKEKKELQIVELNSADTAQLMKLPGIGKYFANAIVKYRNKLGGFVNKYQILEVYHMDTTRFLSIEKHIDVNPFLVKKININTASYEELKSHPYITPNIALSLVNIRNKHGNFRNVSDIRKSVLITNEVYEKLAPYLTTN